ncbi:uncharacterized protein HD556DRAFT_1442795 [Suillus plorans]|uniref:Uncharacterized protein n=1 Tax=Suillus plorans TaxID=116603 RepID=A0A9P7AS79_9AGAM|nr:uncharacterized protein HD556DRAFT_1442795 [Suillus plorans]KAG1794610.1 hypothetical protein HD556DRAFT_1442795 [Suillus plorans]
MASMCCCGRPTHYSLCSGAEKKPLEDADGFVPVSLDPEDSVGDLSVSVFILDGRNAPPDDGICSINAHVIAATADEEITLGLYCVDAPVLIHLSPRIVKRVATIFQPHTKCRFLIYVPEFCFSGVARARVIRDDVIVEIAKFMPDKLCHDSARFSQLDTIALSCTMVVLKQLQELRENTDISRRTRPAAPLNLTDNEQDADEELPWLSRLFTGHDYR